MFVSVPLCHIQSQAWNDGLFRYHSRYLEDRFGSHLFTKNRLIPLPRLLLKYSVLCHVRDLIKCEKSNPREELKNNAVYKVQFTVSKLLNTTKYFNKHAFWGWFSVDSLWYQIFSKVDPCSFSTCMCPSQPLKHQSWTVPRNSPWLQVSLETYTRGSCPSQKSS